MRHARDEDRVRYLNGYRLLYRPFSEGCMVSKNWLGWIYEHRHVAQCTLGRPLLPDEVVHHIDNDRLNNKSENLRVMSKSAHQHEHKPPWVAVCMDCGTYISGKASRCIKCAGLRYGVGRPDKQQLETDISCMSMVAIGRKYGVSDNAVRKWAKKFGIEYRRKKAK